MAAQVWQLMNGGTFSRRIAAAVDFRIAARMAQDLSKSAPYNAGRLVAVAGSKVQEFFRGQRLVVRR
jgi:hypothetical protein